MESDFKEAWNEYARIHLKKDQLTDEQARVHENYALGNRERAQALLDNIGKYLHLDLRKRRVLDVGSAYAGFPIVAAQKGAEAYGVEILDYLHKLGVANAQNEGVVTLINADILDKEITEQLGTAPFDLMILHDVFEHVYDSSALFKRIGEFSHEASVVNFAIPTGDCWQAIEREAHRFAFGLSLLEPGSWAEEMGESTFLPFDRF
jgi:2-polyprenyl-3-methyl-5-hydroxy-6-metoxy-1,4-benzoquinol methylase